MRKIISALLGATMLAGAAFAAPPASAASTSWETTNRGWQIKVHDDATCSAYRDYEGGAAFMLGWQQENKSFWIGFGRNSWGQHIKNDTIYNVSFETDGKAWNGGEFRGSVNPKNGHGALLSNGTLTWPFIDALARANTVRFKVDGETVLTLMLDGSSEALTKALECQKAQNLRSSMAPPQQAPVASAVPAGPSVADVTSPASWTVALHNTGTQMVIDGTLNDRVPVKFVLDTGASGISISRSQARAIGAKVTGQRTVVYADGRRGQVDVVMIPRLTIGSATVTNLEATLENDDVVPLLGKNFLDAFASYEIDNRQSLLILRK